MIARRSSNLTKSGFSEKKSRFCSSLILQKSPSWASSSLNSSDWAYAEPAVTPNTIIRDKTMLRSSLLFITKF